jgi:hypothetical protein
MQATISVCKKPECRQGVDVYGSTYEYFSRRGAGGSGREPAGRPPSETVPPRPSPAWPSGAGPEPVSGPAGAAASPSCRATAGPGGDVSDGHGQCQPATGSDGAARAPQAATQAGSQLELGLNFHYWLSVPR